MLSGGTGGQGTSYIIMIKERAVAKIATQVKILSADPGCTYVPPPQYVCTGNNFIFDNDIGLFALKTK